MAVMEEDGWFRHSGTCLVAWGAFANRSLVAPAQLCSFCPNGFVVMVLGPALSLLEQGHRSLQGSHGRGDECSDEGRFYESAMDLVVDFSSL